MDFFRKNWGLLLYSLVCLALMVVLGLKIRSANAKAAENRKKLEEQLTFFDGVKKDNIKLNEDNQRIAQANRDLAEAKFMQLRQTLAGKYHIVPDAPPTVIEGVRRLQQEIRRMAQKLDEAGIEVGQQCQYFSFDKLALSKKLPAEEDVPKIFRHLRIIQEIVRIIGESEITSIEEIRRPMGLQVLEEDLYTVTPVKIVVVGRPEHVQAFINKMNTQANYLFFLRKIDLLTTDQAPGGVLAGKDATPLKRSGGGTTPGGPDGAGMEMMDPGMAGGGPDRMGPGRGTRRRGRRGGIEAGPGEMGPDGAGMAGKQGAEEPAGPLTRQDLLAFESNRMLSAELRFDLVEFIPPNNEDEE